MDKRKQTRPAPATVSILEYMARGKSIPEIALITQTPARTVKARVERLKEALNAHGHVGHLIYRAVQLGYLEVDRREVA